MHRTFTKSLHFVLAFCVLLSLPAAGQGFLSGNVMDQLSHESLPGAHILLERSNNTTVSDQLGNFKFTSLVPGDYNIKISYVGYEPVIAPVRIKSDSLSVLQI